FPSFSFLFRGIRPRLCNVVQHFSRSVAQRAEGRETFLFLPFRSLLFPFRGVPPAARATLCNTFRGMLQSGRRVVDDVPFRSLSFLFLPPSPQTGRSRPASPPAAPSRLRR